MVVLEVLVVLEVGGAGGGLMGRVLLIGTTLTVQVFEDNEYPVLQLEQIVPLEQREHSVGQETH